MRFALALLVFGVFAIPGAAQSPTILHYDGLGDAARYSNGYVIGWDNPEYTQVTIYGRDTNPVYALPGSKIKNHLGYDAWSVDSDGVVARAYTDTKTSWGGGIDLLDSSGKSIRTIDTTPYVPQHVVFGPDHTIWTVGFIAGNDGRGDDFNVVRHYARSGEKLGEAVPWSEIADDVNTYTALQAIIGSAWLHASKDRIGFKAWLKYDRAVHNTWVEVSLTGQILGKYDLGDCFEICYSPATMTSDGTVYAQSANMDQLFGWTILDRSDGTWHKIGGYPPGRIIGADGNNVVFSQRDENGATLTFVPSGSLPVEKVQAAEVTAPR